VFRTAYIPPTHPDPPWLLATHDEQLLQAVDCEGGVVLEDVKDLRAGQARHVLTEMHAGMTIISAFMYEKGPPCPTSLKTTHECHKAQCLNKCSTPAHLQAAVRQPTLMIPTCPSNWASSSRSAWVSSPVLRPVPFRLAAAPLRVGLGLRAGLGEPLLAPGVRLLYLWVGGREGSWR
jgi:GAF domain-containing protein